MNNKFHTSTSSNNITFTSAKAIIMGVIMTITIGIILNILGLALGVSTGSVASDTGIQTYSTGAVFWLIFTAIAAIFIGAWFTGVLSPTHIKNRLAFTVNGTLTWAIAMLITLLLAASSTMLFLTGIFNLAKTSLSAFSNVPVESLNLDLNNEAFSQTKILISENLKEKNIDPNAAKDILNESKTIFFSNNKQSINQAIDNLASNLSNATLISKEDAKKMVLKWQNNFNETLDSIKSNLQQAKQTALESAAKLLWLLLLVLVISACVAPFGCYYGYCSKYKPLETPEGQNE